MGSVKCPEGVLPRDYALALLSPDTRREGHRLVYVAPESVSGKVSAEKFEQDCRVAHSKWDNAAHLDVGGSMPLFFGYASS